MKALDNFEWSEDVEHEINGYYAVTVDLPPLGVLPAKVNTLIFVRINGEKVYRVVATGFGLQSRLVGNKVLKERIIAAVNQDQEEAGMRFAQELVRCMECGALLTDPESRELGIGPICRTK